MMSRKPIFRIILFMGLCLLTLAVWSASAQETTPESPTFVQITLIGVEPSVVQAGTEARLSIIGNNFTPNTTVRVWNVGFLTTTYINPTALTAILPATAPNGSYVVEVSDPLNGVANLPNAITVVSAPAPPATPIIIPTMPPEPGEPNLIVQGFSVTPSVVEAGGLVSLRFDVINRGSRVAQGISVAIEAGTSISPAPGQANAILPDLFP
ncbi:MAG TPA: IPT/TIG domain-containing protein, partial [Aggregatilineales bacterium]|nr:IPT/TIG domain-containing protein [Aggregatilineales bacterium]